MIDNVVFILLYLKDTFKNLIWTWCLYHRSLWNYVLNHILVTKCYSGCTTHFAHSTPNRMSCRGIKSRPVLLQSTVWWVFWPSGGEVHLEMLRASRLIAAAITSHSISLFYGHSQLWSSLSPFGASLETSARFLFTTSEPGLFPTVGYVRILHVQWFRHISSQI